MTQEPTNAVVKAEEPSALVAIRGQIENREQYLLEVLPKGMDARRFMRVSLMALTKNPDLLACTPGSIIRSIIEAAELGLEPTGAAGGAHLVPFNEKQRNGTYLKKAQLIHDFRGTQHLVRLGGGGEVVAKVVYEGDQFEVYEGTQPRIVHVPAFQSSDPTKITHFYAWSVDHPEKFEVMTKAQVDAVRARSKAANNGPWVSDYAEMGRKTVVKRLCKYLDLIPQYRAAIEEETQREFAPTQTTTASGVSTVRDKLAAKIGAVLPPEPEPDPETIEGVVVAEESANEQIDTPVPQEAPVPQVVEQAPKTEQDAFALAGEAMRYAQATPRRGRR